MPTCRRWFSPTTYCSSASVFSDLSAYCHPTAAWDLFATTEILRMTDRNRVDTETIGSPAAAEGSMKRKLAVGAGWMTVLQLSSKVVEVGFIAVLARILFPDDFGVIGQPGQ